MTTCSSGVYLSPLTSMPTGNPNHFYYGLTSLGLPVGIGVKGLKYTPEEQVVIGQDISCI